MRRMHGAGKWLLVVMFVGMLVTVGCKDADKPGDGEKAKAAPPKVDGVLDDALWKAVKPLSLAKLEEGEDAKSKTNVYVTHDATNLYLAAECFDDAESLKAMVAYVTDHDESDIWSDDCIEFFIDPTGKRETYYQFIINSKGVTWDAFHAEPGTPEKDWEPKYESKTVVGEKSWVVEMTIPLLAFDRTKVHAKTWVFNALRTRTKDDETTYWKPTIEGGSHVPEKFGTLENMPAKTAAP